jgi:hypothetical protein
MRDRRALNVRHRCRHRRPHFLWQIVFGFSEHVVLLLTGTVELLPCQIV